MFHKKQVLILENKEFLFDDISEKAPFYLFLTYCFSEWDLYIVVYPIYFYVMSSNIDIILADINVFDNLTIFVMSYEKKSKVKIFFELGMTRLCDIIYYAVRSLSKCWLAVNAVKIKAGIHITM